MYDQTKPIPFLTRDYLSFEHGVSFQLVLELIAHSTADIEIRGFTKEGHFTFRVSPVGDSTLETFTLNISDVPLYVSVSTAPTSSNTTFAFAAAYLAVDGNKICMLAKGIISLIDSVSWPYQVTGGKTQDEGAIISLSIANPAAGDEASFSVPNHQIWEVLGVGFLLTASATVADRTVKGKFVIAGAVMIERTASATQQASEGQTYSIIPGGTTAVITANSAQEIGIPAGIILRQGDSFETVTTNIQVGDQYSDMVIHMRRWYQPEQPT